MKRYFSMFQLLHQSTTPSITATPPFNPNSSSSVLTAYLFTPSTKPNNKHAAIGNHTQRPRRTCTTSKEIFNIIPQDLLNTSQSTAGGWKRCCCWHQVTAQKAQPCSPCFQRGSPASRCLHTPPYKALPDDQTHKASPPPQGRGSSTQGN